MALSAAGPFLAPLFEGSHACFESANSAHFQSHRGGRQQHHQAVRPEVHRGQQHVILQQHVTQLYRVGHCGLHVSTASLKKSRGCQSALCPLEHFKSHIFQRPKCD